MEDYSFEHAETRYIVQTADKRELNLYLNANKMACVLYDLLEWRRSIYNGKNYDEICFLQEGQLYTEKEWREKDLNSRVASEIKRVYLEDDVEKILGEKLESIADFIFNYME